MRLTVYVLAKRPSTFLVFFSFLICLTLCSYSLITRPPGSQPKTAIASLFPIRAANAIADDPSLPPGFRRLPVASTDPIRFSLRVNKASVKLNEPVELTITAELLNISPTLLFSLPGANTYRLKMLLPPGFEQTGGDFTDYVTGDLAYPSRTIVTYRLTGRFTSVTGGTSFRLLRSHGQADNQSLFVEKATLRLRTLPGESNRKASETASSTTDPTLFVVTEQIPSGARAASTNYRGFLDVATCEAVGGWAVDANNPRQSVQVDIFINNQKVTTITANQERPDVANDLQVKDFNQYGYYWRIPEEYRKNKALAIAVKFTESDQALSHSPRTTDICPGTGEPEPPKPKPEDPPSNAKYYGFLDVATCEAIGGWAINSSNPRSSIQVDIYIDNKKVTTLTADQERPDVSNGIGVKDFNRYGYYWRIPEEYKKNGKLTVAVRPYNTSQELTHSPRMTEVCVGPDKPDRPDPGDPPSNANYFGYLDVATCEAVSGWAIDLNNPRKSVQIDIFINNQKVTTVTTNQERPDVAKDQQVKDFSRFGYYWRIPEEYKKNATLTIAVRPVNTSRDLTRSPRTTEVCVGPDKPEPPKPDNCAFAITTDPLDATCGSTVTLNAKCTGENCDQITYVWSGNGIDRTGQSVQIAAPSTNGQYSYTVTATRKDCPPKTATLVVTVTGCNPPPPPPANCAFSVSTDPLDATCGSTVTLNAKCTGENCDQITYVWSGNGIDRTGQSVQIAAPSTNGQYSYTVTATRKDCPPKTATLVVTVTGCNPPPPPPANCAFAITTDPLDASCGSTVTLNAKCTGENCDQITYVWSGNGIDRTGQSVQITAPSTNGQYSYTVTATRKDCPPKTATLVVTVTGCNPPPPPPANCAFAITADPLDATCGSTVTLNAKCTGENCDQITYVWSGNGIDRTGQSVQIAAPSTNGQYSYTVTATRKDCPPKTATLVVTVTGCNPPPPPPGDGNYPILNSEPPADKRPVLQNDRIRLAIDLGVGGVIREVTDLQVGENMINCMIKSDGKRDPGRDDQISIYALPADNSGWTQNGKPVYRDIGYNPVQGGDIAGNFSPILGYGRTDNMLYCKTRGLHWGINNELGDYTVEQWIRLEGNIVRRHVRIIGSRADQTKYPESRQQELPCTYTNSAYYQYYVVQGDPYTNAGLVNVNTIPNIGGSGQMLSQHPGHGETGPHNVDASEPWIMAVRPNTNRGLALHTPFSHEFKAAMFGELGYGPPESIHAGYIANGMTMIIDPNGVYEFDINMVVGTRDEMRNTLNTLPRSETKPHYVFANNPIRHGFYYRKGYDQGFPMGSELIITPTDRRFRLLSPRKGYRSSETRMIYVRFRAITTETKMVFDWRKVGQTELEAEQANQAITFNIRGDNQYQTIAIPVGNHPLWNGTINDFSLRFANPTETPLNGQQLGVKWISTENLGDN